MSDIELKPCPFCGYPAKIERRGDHRQSTIYQCQGCNCSLETGEEWGHGTRWNDRAQLPEVQTLVEAVREQSEYLSSCGEDGELLRNTLAALAPFTNGVSDA
jgi:hypothetical protein